MAYVLDDAHLKLKRAEFHIESLRTDIRDAGRGEPYSIPLREHLDEDSGVLHLRIGSDTTRPERWGPMIGDALHNLRSALDNGWWQLASKHLHQAPTEEQAPSIQFPILKPGGVFNAGSIGKWVGEKPAAFAEALQVDEGGDGSHISPFRELRRLSNEDKHRNLHVTVYVLGDLRVGVNFVGDGPPPPNDSLDMSLPGATFHPFRKGGPKPGDEALTIPPNCWIRQPDFQFDAFQAGFISIDGKTDILVMLDSIHHGVSAALNGMELLLEGKAVEVKFASEERSQFPPPPPNSESFDLPAEPGPVEVSRPID